LLAILLEDASSPHFSDFLFFCWFNPFGPPDFHDSQHRDNSLPELLRREVLASDVPFVADVSPRVDYVSQSLDVAKFPRREVRASLGFRFEGFPFHDGKNHERRSFYFTIVRVSVSRSFCLTKFLPHEVAASRSFRLARFLPHEIKFQTSPRALAADWGDRRGVRRVADDAPRASLQIVEVTWSAVCDPAELFRRLCWELFRRRGFGSARGA